MYLQDELEGAEYSNQYNANWYDPSLISFSISFLFFRVTAKFTNNESLKSRFLEGILCATIAAINEYYYNEVESYYPSYSVISASYIYKQNYLSTTSSSLNLAFTSGSVLFSKYFFDNGVYRYFIPATSYFYFAKNFNINNVNLIYGTLGVFTENIFLKDNFYDNNYIAFSLTTSLLLNKILYNNYYTTAISVVIGTLLAKYEQEIIKKFIPIESFDNSYNTLCKFIDKDYFDSELYRMLAISANLYIGIGNFDNLIITKVQGIDNRLISLYGNAETFSHFLTLAKHYLIYIAPLYLVMRTSIEVYNEYNVHYMVTNIQKDLIEKKIISSTGLNTFSTKADYNIQVYLDDISNIIKENNKMINEVLFILPKIYTLTNIPIHFLSGLPVVIGIDLIVSIILQYLIDKKQIYLNKSILCNSELERIIQHDLKNHENIIHKEGLDFTKEQWMQLYNCKNNNIKFSNLLDKTIFFINQFYIWDELYTILKIFVASTIDKGFITNKDEVHLYVKVLQSTLDTVLFRTKHNAELKSIDASIERLEELGNILMTNKSHYYNSETNYTIGEVKNILEINEFSFLRGNEIKGTSFYAKNLIFKAGAIYAVRGENGSGKSSFIKLLINILEENYDSSFISVRGNINFPSDSFLMIPQKDYCPLNINLLALILYPLDIKKFSLEEQNNYYITITDLFDRFKIIDSNQLELSSFLNSTKENWCNELSGGQLKKIFLIKAFIQCPKILFLDEIFSPLDPISSKIIASEIMNYPCFKDTITLIVTHQDNSNNNLEYKELFDMELKIENHVATISEL